MTVKRNYQKELDRVTAEYERLGIRPRLLLHSCCGPCSSYVLEYLSKYFDITVYYYNPNIEPSEEYYLRLNTQIQIAGKMELEGDPGVIDGEYDPGVFHNAVKGLEKEPEGGARCTECFKLRLERTAKAAKEKGFDLFTTTLTVSPHKNAEVINRIGEETGTRYDIPFLNSDFKKRDGYKRSIELSKEYGLYRQNYCGCVYSMRETTGK